VAGVSLGEAVAGVSLGSVSVGKELCTSLPAVRLISRCERGTNKDEVRK
jgi:hypothetical protein